jgi:hypothetical protein
MDENGNLEYEDVKDDPDIGPDPQIEQEKEFTLSEIAKQFERIREQMNGHENEYWTTVMTLDDHDSLRNRYADFVTKHPNANVPYDAWVVSMVRIATRLWRATNGSVSDRLELKRLRKALHSKKNNMSPSEYRKAMAALEDNARERKAKQ